MINARLIKALEKKGFLIEFPDYNSIEEIIIEIIKTHNPRISFSLPIFLQEDFDYKKVALTLNASEKKEFNKAILISNKIYLKEKLKTNIQQIIKENAVKSKFPKTEFKGVYDAFKEARLRTQEKEQKIIEKQSKLRLNLDLNKSLSVIFSPAKIRIMQKIFAHEKLTNTELKYYYKSISNIDKAVLNPSMQDYLRIIEISKKEVLEK